MRSSGAGAWIDTGDRCDMIGCMRNGTGISMFIIAPARRTAQRWTTCGGFFRFLELRRTVPMSEGRNSRLTASDRTRHSGFPKPVIRRLTRSPCRRNNEHSRNQCGAERHRDDSDCHGQRRRPSRQRIRKEPATTCRQHHRFIEHGRRRESEAA